MSIFILKNVKSTESLEKKVWKHRKIWMIYQLLTFCYTYFLSIHLSLFFSLCVHAHTHVFCQTFQSRLQTSLNFTPKYFSMYLPKSGTLFPMNHIILTTPKKLTIVLSNIHTQIFSIILKYVFKIQWFIAQSTRTICSFLGHLWY